MLSEDKIREIASQVGYMGEIDEDFLLDHQQLTESEVRFSMESLIKLWR